MWESTVLSSDLKLYNKYVNKNHHHTNPEMFTNYIKEIKNEIVTGGIETITIDNTWIITCLQHQTSSFPYLTFQYYLWNISKTQMHNSRLQIFFSNSN